MDNLTDSLPCSIDFLFITRQTGEKDKIEFAVIKKLDRTHLKHQ